MIKAPKNLWLELERARVNAAISPSEESLARDDVFSVNDYAKKYSIPRRTAYDQIRRLVEAGQVERVFMQRRTPYYAIKGGK